MQTFKIMLLSELYTDNFYWTLNDAVEMSTIWPTTMGINMNKDIVS